MFISTIIGNLGADAEVKDSNGKKFVTLSIAESRKIKQQDGTERTITNWYDAIIGDENHPVLPFLKQGVKVCVMGDTSLRVFSSKKDRMMKAGATIHVQRIELCGGSSDDVPREIIDPDTSTIYNPQKYYWINFDTKGMKKDELKEFIDVRGRRFVMNKQGFVAPMQEEQPAEESAE